MQQTLAFSLTTNRCQRILICSSALCCVKLFPSSFLKQNNCSPQKSTGTICTAPEPLNWAMKWHRPRDLGPCRIQNLRQGQHLTGLQPRRGSLSCRCSSPKAQTSQCSPREPLESTSRSSPFKQDKLLVLQEFQG